MYNNKTELGGRPNNDATMQRGVRGHPIGIRDVHRNKRINHTRAKCERVYAAGKTVFGYGTIKRSTGSLQRRRLMRKCQSIMSKN